MRCLLACFCACDQWVASRRSTTTSSRRRRSTSSSSSRSTSSSSSSSFVQWVALACLLERKREKGGREGEGREGEGEGGREGLCVIGWWKEHAGMRVWGSVYLQELCIQNSGR